MNSVGQNDAAQAYLVVTGQEDEPSWYDARVRLGQASDATSIKNLYATLPYYDEYVKIRNKYNLNVPKISLTDVAVARVDADYSSKKIDHARHYNSAEYLAWSSKDDPNAAWMGEKAIWDKAVKKDPSLASYKNDLYGLLQAKPDFAEKVGHYLNLIDPKTSSYGYALNTDKKGEYYDVEAWDAGYGDPSLSVDEFR